MTDEPRDEAADEHEEQLRRALDMHLGGMSAKKIGEQLGLTATQAKKLVESALGERVAAANLSAEVRTEIARLDTMQWALWPQVKKGNFEAIERALALSERRERLVNPKTNTRRMRKAFDKTVRACEEIDPALDSAIIEYGRIISDYLDEALVTSRGELLNKAMYMMPHLTNALKEMGATPAARKALKGDAAPEVAGKLKTMRANVTALKTKGA